MKTIGMKDKGYTLKDGFSSYIKYQTVKNLSEASIEYYNRCYTEFTRVIAEDTILKNLTLGNVQDYILYLKKKDIVDITVNTYVRGIRAFLYYLMSIGLMDTFKIKLIKANKRIKETYNEEELKILLRKPDIKKCKFSEYRNWVIINFLLGTGCRLRTLRNIKINDLDFTNNLIKFKVTKSRREQIIPMSHTLSSVLSEYMQYRSYENEDDYLFCTVFGNQMQKETVQGAIGRYNKSRGVYKTSLHCFRRTFGTSYVCNGGNIFSLQSILGHSDISTTRLYFSIENGELKKNFEQYCALDQLGQVKSKKAIQMKKKR
ncbi:MAG: hypothetical protein A2Y18_05245 [Clostridiales bacterium GWD2_32_19]|nr:MAG: hypothetical protein A2Y18_05245 [Clostridiales bacterium GWD2_32_19]